MCGIDMFEQKNIERYDTYLKDDDYLMVNLGDGLYQMVRIIDMQPGTPQFTVELCERRNSRYYFSKARRLNPTRFKVIRMFQ